ncbi:hypothetical protein [Planktothrix tepida]|uniref:hypothetical protein n=1 Tax=Planktothrix tepida TaxID=1678309 RepID=UPI0020B31ADB|nr:hypothetical protein [Planktothrix tepida]
MNPKYLRFSLIPPLLLMRISDGGIAGLLSDTTLVILCVDLAAWAWRTRAAKNRIH